MRLLALEALFVLAACAGPDSSGLPTSSSSGAAAPAQSPTPAPPLPAEVAAWSAYSSSEYGFALRYPPAWFSLGNLGAPATESYFSNHKDAGSPMNLGVDGIFVILSADCQYWLGPNITLVSRSDVLVGYTQVARYVVFDTTPDGAFYAADANVFANSSCYRLSMIGWAQPVVEANLADYDLMLSSLRFSARTLPVGSPHPTTLPAQPS